MFFCFQQEWYTAATLYYKEKRYGRSGQSGRYYELDSLAAIQASIKKFFKMYG